MKKLLYILSIALLAGCNGFLDTENLTKKDSSNFPKSEADIDGILTSVYAANIEVINGNEKWQNIFLLNDAMADYAVSGGGLGDKHIRAINEFKVSGENMYSGMWRRYYRGIYRANFLLESEQKINWTSEANRSKILGQAYFLRAQYYFDLVRLFERVPLTLSTKAENLPQADPQDTYRQIFSDLKMAITLLPNVKFAEAPKSELGRVTKWAAEAMMARAYLFYSGFYKQPTITLNDNTTLDKAQVLTYIEDCISNSGHDLMPDFRNLWPYAYANTDYKYAKDNNLSWVGETGNNKETVYAIKYSVYATTTSLSYCNHICLFYGLRGQSLNPFGKGWGFCAVVPKLYNEWSDADLRKKGTIFNVNDKTTENMTYKWNAQNNYNETGFFAKKYMPVNVKDGSGKLVNYSCVLYGVADNFQLNNTQDLVIIRFADILLMAAELGSPNAQNYMDRVRTRAGLGSVAPTLENIKTERMHELAFEGVRLHDLMRWGDLKTAVNTMKLNVPVKTLGESTTKTVTFREECRGFLPIPEDEMKLSNGMLKQNPGWGIPEAMLQE